MEVVLAVILSSCALLWTIASISVLIFIHKASKEAE